MSTQLINNKDGGVVLDSPFKESSKGNISLAAVAFTGSQLLEAFGISSSEENAGGLGFLDLEEERERMEEAEGNQKEFVQSSNENDESTSGLGSIAKKFVTGEDAIFEAAGLLSKLHGSAQTSLEQQLQNQITILNAQLAAMQQAEVFWEKFAKDWEAFQSNPSIATLEAVIADLENHFSGNTTLTKELQDWLSGALTANNEENTWKSHSWLWKLFHGQTHDPHDLQNYLAGAVSGLKNFAIKAVGSPDLFESAMLNGQSAFQKRTQLILVQIQDLSMLVQVLQGKGRDALFTMEALLMDLEKMAIDNNTEKSKQQAKIAQATILGIQNNLTKIQKELAQASEKSDGLIGWIKDIVKGVAHLLVAAFDAISGQESAALSQLQDAGNNMKDLGEGLLDLVKLIGEAFEALGLAIASGAEAAVGNKKETKKLLALAKTVGEKMLANPALKTVSEIVMAVIIAVSVITQQYWLAAVMIVLFVLSETGVMTKLTNAISSAIENDMGGKHSALAKLLADIIVVVIVTVLTAGAGAAEAGVAIASESAATLSSDVLETIGTIAKQAVEAAMNGVKQVAGTVADDAIEETGIELQDMASLGGTELATDVEEEAAVEGNNAAEEVSNAARVAKRAAQMGSIGFGSSLGSSSLGLDIAELAGGKNKKTLEIILELLQAVIAAVTAAVGGFSIMTSAMSEAADAIDSEVGQMAKIASRVSMGAAGVGAVATASQGSEMIIQGLINEDIQRRRGDNTILESVESMNNQAIQITSSQLSTLMKEFEQIVNSAFNAPALAEQNTIKSLIQG